MYSSFSIKSYNLFFFFGETTVYRRRETDDVNPVTRFRFKKNLCFMKEENETVMFHGKRVGPLIILGTLI